MRRDASYLKRPRVAMLQLLSGPLFCHCGCPLSSFCNFPGQTRLDTDQFDNPDTRVPLTKRFDLRGTLGSLCSDMVLKRSWFAECDLV